MSKEGSLARIEKYKTSNPVNTKMIEIAEKDHEERYGNIVEKKESVKKSK